MCEWGDDSWGTHSGCGLAEIVPPQIARRTPAATQQLAPGKWGIIVASKLFQRFEAMIGVSSMSRLYLKES